MRENYEIEMRRVLEEDNFRYCIVGSPENLRTVHIVKANTLKEIWEQLWELNEIDKVQYLEDNEDKEAIITEPDNYEIAIRTYINLDNNFCYNQAKLSLTDNEKIQLLRELVGEIVVNLNNGKIISDLYSGTVELNNIYKEEDEIPKESLLEFKKELKNSLKYVKDISNVRELTVRLEEVA